MSSDEVYIQVQTYLRLAALIVMPVKGPHKTGVRLYIYEIL